MSLRFQTFSERLMRKSSRTVKDQLTCAFVGAELCTSRINLSLPRLQGARYVVRQDGLAVKTMKSSYQRDPRRTLGAYCVDYICYVCTEGAVSAARVFENKTKQKKTKSCLLTTAHISWDVTPWAIFVKLDRWRYREGLINCVQVRIGNQFSVGAESSRFLTLHQHSHNSAIHYRAYRW